MHSYPQARITCSVTVSFARGVHLFIETSGAAFGTFTINMGYLVALGEIKEEAFKFADTGIELHLFTNRWSSSQERTNQVNLRVH